MNRFRQEIAELDPGYGALVMATGIVSVGLSSFGWDLLSDVLLWAAIAAMAVLLVAYVWRAVAHPRRTLADARDPVRSFGYFSLVAAPNVVGARLALDHHLLATAVFALVSIPVWVVLIYAIPGAMLVGRRREPILPRINGSWFMWVVATHSLAVAAAILAPWRPGLAEHLVPAAVGLWGIGVVLYLMLAGLVVARLLEAPVTPHALSPAYWVYMGATAITVLAAAKILALPASLPLLVATRDVVSGLAFLLWAFGSWWIPMLLVFAVWRHIVHREPIRYDPSFWSLVFPLGMYAAASEAFGHAAKLEFMVDIARVEVWVGFAAFVCVAVAMGADLLRPRPAVAGQEEGPE